mmetsp:Transcript_27839/g.69787  ORF Transcript_27839/g.69787 Transcript_27839/m.69787 type:complete len:448 (-) Transcript_27839:119-1462(-)|eukprot:CAMPEP_0177651572 /NCGR_PEP_ID=MMETSP0447-20121125/12632_1 /TAXON_ID=0 /ORGANISM="Stygamoeba regulata, Strain BSH-02190019" /LENGTH=447 /DNA_ID=CAMNT_0019154687 /DNA_START=79 /DNA_END=1422 /DNA_ORIENTATION=-
MAYRIGRLAATRIVAACRVRSSCVRPLRAFSTATDEGAFKPPVKQTPTTWFAHVKQGPPDAILGITEAFQKDQSDVKINLGVGAYRNQHGKPWVLPSIQMAERKIHGMDHEYAPITGPAKFGPLAADLLFGENSPAIKDKRVVSTQSISGTGALRILAEFLKRYFPHTEVYVPKPTWANHIPIMNDTGFDVKFLRYYNPATCGLDFDNYIADLKTLPESSVVLLHCCAHNPTGVDPSPDQWREICKVFKEKKHFPFFDSAYQGFATGDLAADAFPVRLFVEEGLQMVVAQSFAKNFGLYGHRCGAAHIVTANQDEAARVLSQLKIMIRPAYSNPPVHGARLVETILGDSELRAQWTRDVQSMAGRIIDMRKALVDKLKALGSTRDWKHITNQIGMFCYTGLTTDQVDALRTDHHVYMTKDGRISIAGITPANVDHLAKSIHAVTKSH